MKTLNAQIEFFAANDFAARRAIVEAAHAEALEMNRQFDIDGVNSARRQSQHRNALPERQAGWLEQDHADALAMDVVMQEAAQ